MFQELCLASVVLVLTYIVLSFVLKPKGMPPGPTPLPILGNMLSVIRWTSQKNMHIELTKLAKKYHGKVFTLQLPDQRIVVINSASTAREALVTNRDDFAGRPFMFTFDYVTRGSKDIGAQDFNPTLSIQRKIVHSAIRLYQPKLENKVNKEVDELIKRLIAYNGKALDPLTDVILAVMNVICAMVYGDRYEINDPEFQMIFDYNQKMFPLLGALNILNIFPFLIHFPIKDSKLIKFVIDTRDKLLNRKYHEHQESYQDGVIRDLTDALIKALKEAEEEDCKSRGVITEDHLVMTMADAFSAGFETTSTTIIWFLIYMARHQDVQAKVQSELDAVIGKDSSPSGEDRTRLHYSFATVEEAIRLSSVGSIIIPRKATRDSTLEGYNIPKDTTIFVNAWAIHHDDKEWENPYDFVPERFLDDDGKLMQVSGIKSFLPFGAGRRVCVGETLAKQQIFLICTQLLQRFSVEPEVPGSPPSMKGIFEGIIHYPMPFKVCFKDR